jgi:hypothetical protein
MHAATPRLPGTLDVCPSGCPYAHIQDAINAASSGDTIDIGAGTYAEHLDIEKSLTLLGAGMASTIIDGSNSGTVVTIGLSNTAALVMLSGVTIQHGNTTDSGGGIDNVSGTLTLSNSTVISNTAASSGYGGGGIFNGSFGSVMLSNSTVSGNTAASYAEGGGINNGGTLSMTNSTVADSSAFGGGGISNGGTLTLTNSMVDGNTATSNGGGGISNGGGGTLMLANCTVSGNSATGSYLDGGGGIDNFSGTLTLTNSTVVSNTIVSNTADVASLGGGIYINASSLLTLTNSTVSGNRADIGGGIDINSFGTQVLTNTLTNSTVSDNRADIGGGIDSSGTLTLANSAVISNTATGDGGGVYDFGGWLTLTNSTVGDNSTENGNGGGIYINTSTLLALTNSTVSENAAAADGGGIYNSYNYNPAVITNTIMAGNMSPSSPDCYGQLFSGGYNLLGRASGCSGLTDGVSGDQVGVYSFLGPLQDNGGPTLTMAPQPGSPVVDAVPASNCTLTTDQRGQARPDEDSDNGNCDIGAVEGVVSGTSPSADVSPSSLDFGAQLVGTTSVPKAVTITNTGTVPLGFFAIFESGPDFQDFNFDSSSTCDYSIPVLTGDSCTVALAFSPAITETAGTSNATLYIYDNATDSPQVVPLSGNRTNPSSVAPSRTPMPPTATPTNTPVPSTATHTAPPTATPTRPTATTAPSTATVPPVSPTAQPTTATAVCPLHPTAPALSVGIAPHAVLAIGSRAFAPSRTLPSVTGGGTLPLTIHTAPRAAITASLDVVATRVIVHGTGVHRTRTTRQVVLYHTAAWPRRRPRALHGADARRLPTAKPGCGHP